MRNLTEKYNLGILYPELSKQWHLTKNGDLTPYDVTPKKGTKASWLCEACSKLSIE